MGSRHKVGNDVPEEGMTLAGPALTLRHLTCRRGSITVDAGGGGFDGRGNGKRGAAAATGQG